MIEAIILYLHIVAAIYVYTARWQAGGIKEGVLGTAMFSLVFLICWSLTGALARAIMPNTDDVAALTADTLSLLLVVGPVSAFFWLFFVRAHKT